MTPSPKPTRLAKAISGELSPVAQANKASGTPFLTRRNESEPGFICIFSGRNELSVSTAGTALLVPIPVVPQNGPIITASFILSAGVKSLPIKIPSKDLSIKE